MWPKCPLDSVSKTAVDEMRFMVSMAGDAFRRTAQSVFISFALFTLSLSLFLSLNLSLSSLSQSVPGSDQQNEILE